MSRPAPAPAPAPSPLGLRERKRLRTRQTLLRAAREVFAERGYEATTIDEIAERAEISPRTVFRYFGSKEEMALADLAEFYETLVGELSARDPGEAPMQALTGAARATWSGPGGFEPTAFDALLALCEESPALLAALLRHAEERERDLVAEIMRREGARGDELTIRTVVATFLAAMRVATDVWRERGTLDAAALSTTLDDCLDGLRRQTAL